VQGKEKEQEKRKPAARADGNELDRPAYHENKIRYVQLQIVRSRLENAALQFVLLAYYIIDMKK